jgi:hypothetical protein
LKTLTILTKLLVTFAVGTAKGKGEQKTKKGKQLKRNALLYKHKQIRAVSYKPVTITCCLKSIKHFATRENNIINLLI